jgi:hypothetical protein
MYDIIGDIHGHTDKLVLLQGGTYLSINDIIRRKIRFKWWEVNQQSTYQSAAVTVLNAKLVWV